MIVVSSLMAVVYIWRVVEAAYFHAPDPSSTAVEATLPLLLATWGAVLLNFYYGLMPGIPVHLASTAAQILGGQLP